MTPATDSRALAPALDVTKTRRDLHAIVDMVSRLRLEAWHRGDDPDLPGGDAMVMLGPAAHLPAWLGRKTHHARARRAALAAGDPPPAGPRPGIDDLDADASPPLLTLAWLEDDVRQARDEPTDLRATVHRAADYLADRMHWIAGHAGRRPNYPAADELAAEIRHTRARLEDVLREGDRTDRTNVPCRHDGCAGARLERVWGRRIPEDGYRCPSCREFYSEPEYRLARAIDLSTREDEVWMRIADAARSTGRSVRTIRSWKDRNQVRTMCLIPSRELRVWWPDVRAMHRAAESRSA